MNYLKLASEVFYANITKLAEDPTQSSNLEAIISFFSLVIENSIDCLSISVRAVCLEKPGTHDYLQRLSESICIAIEAKTFRRDILYQKRLLMVIYSIKLKPCWDILKSMKLILLEGLSISLSVYWASMNNWK